MIRLSVTDLTSYQWWESDEEAPLAKLIADLTGEGEETHPMLAGGAFAKVMENARAGTELTVVEQDGFTFDFTQLDATLEMPAVRELRGELVVTTRYGEVLLVGKCDSLGAALHDQKLSAKWDAEKYIDSLQWRAYCMMFGVPKFVYDVFQCSWDRKDPNKAIIREYHPLPFYAYAGMDRDVRRAVTDLAGIVVQHDLAERMATRWQRRQQRKAEAAAAGASL